MNRFFLLIVFFTFFSCDYFDKKKVYTEDLVKEELQAFNWKDVDEYPAFEICVGASGKAAKKTCFESTLRQILNSNLEKYEIIVSEDIDDTVILEITIDNKGAFKINEIRSSETIRNEIPQFDSLLRKSLDSLPKIYPAIKRSQQVTTQFSLPVIIKVE